MRKSFRLCDKQTKFHSGWKIGKTLPGSNRQTGRAVRRLNFKRNCERICFAGVDSFSGKRVVSWT